MPERIVYGTTLTADDAARLRAGLPAGAELRLRGPLEVGAEDLGWATVLCCNHVPAEKIARCAQLRWLHVPAASLNAFRALQALRPDLHLTATGPINARAVAEHGLALWLALRRGLPQIIAARAGAHWLRPAIAARPPGLIAGSEAHVLGYGPVARALVAVLAALGARVTVFRREADGAEPPVARIGALRELAREIGEADAVFGVLPEVPATRHLLDRAVLAALKPGAVVINLGRGNLLDHAALVDALRAGAIAGAALDVFETEPLPPDSPLWSAPNLIVSPHVAGLFPGNTRAGVEAFLREFAAFRCA